MTLLLSAVSAVDTHFFRPLVKQPVHDLMQAATLQVGDDGKPINLDKDGNQEGFHPFGAILTASVLAAAILKFTNMVSHIAVPRCLRSHAILVSKATVGTCLACLTKTAIHSIQKQAANA